MFHVPTTHVEEAWAEGAFRLGEACKRADGDITPEQLKAELLEGKKTLLGHDGGWMVVEVQNYPNRKILHIDAIYAPKVQKRAPFDELVALAKHNGCDAIQAACQPSSARLWRRFGFRPTYQILRVEV